MGIPQARILNPASSGIRVDSKGAEAALLVVGFAVVAFDALDLVS